MAGFWLKKIAFWVLLVSFAGITRYKAQGIWYVTGNSQPWNQQANINAMNAVFGMANWSTGSFQNVNTAALFSPTTCFIYIDGSDQQAVALSNFLQANLTTLQNWVFNGGNLLLNAAPNTGTNINFGFGGVTLNYGPGNTNLSTPGVAANGQNGHPIFNGPYTPIQTNYTGNFFSHGNVTGPGLTALINGTVSGNQVVSLCQKVWGSGKALFGAMTTSNFHQPQPQSNNLINNILSYLKVCCPVTVTAVSNTVCLGSGTALNASITMNGNLPANPTSYTWLPSGATGSTTIVTPTVNTTYSVIATTSTGCQNMGLITVSVAPPCITVNSTSITCASLGSATVQSNGGIGPFSYTWIPSNQSGSVATGLSPGTYSIIVHDQGNNFTYTANTVFTSLIPLTGQLNHTPSFPCNGMSTGTANYTNIQGGTPNQNYMWTNGTLTLTVPQPQNLTAGNWTSTVTDALTGCVIYNTFSISQPPPIQLFYSTSAQSVCINQTVMLNCNAIGGTSPYTFLWSGGGTGNGVVMTESVVGTHVYTLLALDANTCSASTTLAVQVLSNPTVWASPVYICPFQTGTFTANGATNYTWMPGSVNGSLCTVNPTVMTIYTLTGEFSGCQGTATTTLFIKPTPPAAISMSASVCENQNILLTASGGTAYSWSGPANFQSNISSPGIAQIQLNQSGIYQVTVTGVNSCTASTNASLNVLPLPFISASGSTVCSTQTLVLSATSSMPGSQFIWTGPNAFYLNGSQVVWPNPTTAHSGIYTVCITSPQGCTVSATAQASIVQQPVISVTSNAPLCEHNTLQLVANSIAGSSFNWNGPNGFSGNGAVQTLTQIPLNAQGLYQLQTTFGPCSIIQNYSVQVFPLPQIQITSNQPVCEFHSLQLTASSTATGFIQYQWSGPFNFNASGAVANRDSCSQNYNGIYQVWGTDAHGCVGFAQKPIQVLPNPTLTSISLTNCINAFSTLQAQGAASYTWFSPVSILSTQYSVSVPPLQQMVSQSYTVIGSASNGCTAQSVSWVFPKAIPQPSILASSSLACLGDSLYFEATGALRYEWYGPDGFFISGNPISYPVLNTKMAGIYTLTAYDAFGCSNTRLHYLELTLAAQGYISPVTSRSCAPYCSTLQLIPNANNTASVVSVQWLPSNGLSGTGNYLKTLCMDNPGLYPVSCIIKDAHHCKTQISAQFTADASPTGEFTTQALQSIKAQQSFTLQPLDSADFYYWTFYFPQGVTHSTNKNPICNIQESGCYPVALQVRQGNCKANTQHELCAIDSFRFYIPDVFTPNTDALNDYFKPSANMPFKYNLQIFDRWGILIFESTHLQEGWDGTSKGKSLEEGTYLYKIKLSTPDQELIIKTGSVLLMR